MLPKNIIFKEMPMQDLFKDVKKVNRDLKSPEPFSTLHLKVLDSTFQVIQLRTSVNSDVMYIMH